MITSTIKKIIIAVVILGVGVAVYYFFFSDSKVSLDTTNLSDTNMVGHDILVLTERLKVTNIDSSIFSGELLANLIDFSTPLTNEPQGRLNPFASIGTDNPSAVVATTSKSTNKKVPAR